MCVHLLRCLVSEGDRRAAPQQTQRPCSGFGTALLHPPEPACGVTGSARPRSSNCAGEMLGLLGAGCLVLILTECTVCGGKSALSHVLRSTDVREACALDSLRLPEAATWKGGGCLRGIRGKQDALGRGCIETRNTTFFSCRTAGWVL